MTDPKDRMTIFPEEKSGETPKPGKPIEKSAKQPGKNEAISLGDEGQERAQKFRNDRNRQSRDGQMGGADD